MNNTTADRADEVNSTESILRTALKLSDTERAKLAQELIASLDPGDHGPESSITTAWDNEIAQRMAKLDRGAETVSAADVLQTARQSLSDQ